MLLGILLIAFALGLYSVIKYNFFKPEGAPPLMHSWVPFVGSIVPFGVNFLSFIEGGTKQLGKVWTTKLMGKRVTIVSHRDTHEYFFKPRNEVLSPQEVYRFMKPVFGPGVVYDATHARMREQLSFVADELSLNNMKRYVPMIQKQVRLYLDEHWGNSGTVNLLDSMGSLLISTAAMCLFGTESLAGTSPERFAQLLCEIESGINPVAVFIHWLPSFGLFRQRKARKEFEQIALDILARQRKQMEVEGDRDPNGIVEALLQAVYRDGTPMTEEERVGIMLGVLFAGQHTSLITTTWSVAYLSSPQYKEMKARHEEEFKTYSNGEGDDAEIDYDGLMEMHYTESIVKEVLRLHPPLIMLMREVCQPLKIGEYTVPVGDTLAVSPLASMRCEDVFEKADTFDPSRFCDRSEGAGQFDFVAFGGGAHKCLGGKFGLLQTQVVLSTIMHDYDIELVKGDVPVPDYTTMVVGPSLNESMIRYTKKQH